jgi:serine phosphatase RsbU (regulator of sigma subunit)/pSer/pThr/pTyr-binding forkhead associated (FHA) protein
VLKLLGTDGSHYYAWTLEPGRYTVGRKQECDLVISDMTVSRKHAEIEVDASGDECFLVDLNSHNGTMVNGERVTSRVQIKPGDHILFGHVEFKLTTVDEPVSSSRTKLPTTELLGKDDVEKSMFLSIHDALQPLPTEVTDRPEVLPTLFEMAKMLVLPEPKEVMLERSLALVAKAVPAERLAVLLITDEQRDIQVAARHLPGGQDPGSFTLSQTIINEILTEKNAILIGNLEDDPRFAAQQSIIMSQLKSAMAVPLFVEGKVLGILYADTTNPQHRYGDEFLRLFATFGNLIAFRLMNYTLLTQRQEKEVLESENRRASLIQRNLLVKEPPSVAGYTIHSFQEQCRAVGGDLYDLVLFPDGRLLIMVADVSGKGMGAALLMANILASFRILYEERQFDLCKAVKQVSMQLFEHTSPEDFATLFIGLVNPDKDTVTFCNAGHNPPLVVREEGKVEYLDAGGLMIGAFQSSDWPEQTIKMSHGDLLFIFTDGVTEAQRGEEFYGDKRTEELVITSRHLTPPEIARKLVDDIKLFVKDSPRSDDITMLLIKKDMPC